jgi:HSP20 family protein
MAITRWDPFTTALSRFDREFDELVRRGWANGSAATRSFVPPVEMVARDTDVVIRLELPGVDVEKDVEITVDKGRLIIRGERRDEHAEEGKGVLVRELRYGAFRREFALPEGCTVDAVEASYDQGMLEVVVRDVVKPEPEPQQVQIRRADSQKSLDASAG